MENSVIIRLAFTFDREIILFEICNKIIVYKDRKWPNGFQFMPKDPAIIKAIVLSRNKIRKEMISWINETNSGYNLEQYKRAVDDEAISDIVKSDCISKGCVFRKKQYIMINDKGEEEEVMPDEEQ